jgi:hypothetical protein
VAATIATIPRLSGTLLVRRCCPLACPPAAMLCPSAVADKVHAAALAQEQTRSAHGRLNTSVWVCRAHCCRIMLIMRVPACAQLPAPIRRSLLGTWCALNCSSSRATAAAHSRKRAAAQHAQHCSPAITPAEAAVSPALAKEFLRWPPLVVPGTKHAVDRLTRPAGHTHAGRGLFKVGGIQGHTSLTQCAMDEWTLLLSMTVRYTVFVRCILR